MLPEFFHGAPDRLEKQLVLGKRAIDVVAGIDRRDATASDVEPERVRGQQGSIDVEEDCAVFRHGGAV